MRVGVQSGESAALICNWNERNALQVQFCISVSVHVFHVGEICRDRANVGDSDPDCGKIVTMWGISGFWLEPNPNAAGTPSTRFLEQWRASKIVSIFPPLFCIFFFFSYLSYLFSSFWERSSRRASELLWGPSLWSINGNSYGFHVNRRPLLLWPHSEFLFRRI